MGHSLFYERFSTVQSAKIHAVSHRGHGEDTALQTSDTSCHYLLSIDYFTIKEHTSMKRAFYALLEFESKKNKGYRMLLSGCSNFFYYRDENPTAGHHVMVSSTWNQCYIDRSNSTWWIGSTKRQDSSWDSPHLAWYSLQCALLCCMRTECKWVTFSSQSQCPRTQQANRCSLRNEP